MFNRCVYVGVVRPCLWFGFCIMFGLSGFIGFLLGSIIGEIVARCFD